MKSNDDKHSSGTLDKRLVLGRLLATPGALDAITTSGQTPAVFLARHQAGDWGVVCDEDRQLNDQACLDGSRILSAYTTALGVRLWVITEAEDESGQRTCTTILLPQEY